LKVSGSEGCTSTEFSFLAIVLKHSFPKQVTGIYVYHYFSTSKLVYLPKPLAFSTVASYDDESTPGTLLAFKDRHLIQDETCNINRIMSLIYSDNNQLLRIVLFAPLCPSNMLCHKLRQFLKFVNYVVPQNLADPDRTYNKPPKFS
jgi:hypothetical protein